MSARRRVLALVLFACVAAVGVVGVAVVSANDDADGTQTTEAKPRPGRPPLAFALGFRNDAEARDLARAQASYDSGRLDRARALFERYGSLEAKVGQAFASWPETTLARLEQLAKLYPKSAVVQLHLGLARLWANEGDPIAAWQMVVDEEPDTPYAVLAGNLLFPKLPRGLPAFVPSFSAPAEIVRLPAARQLGALRQRAETGVVRDLLLYGVGLQRVGQPVSAAGTFDEAARRYPRDVEAQAASAVGRFDKARPEIAFGKLGPLTRTFPNEPTVRFHLGVLLLWTGRIRPAERQFRLAADSKPGSPLAREAARYLETIRNAKRSGGG